jgi:sugar lactone lactonase YvrE
VYVADWRGGVTQLQPEGGQVTWQGQRPDGGALRPNGIALLADGSFLLAQLGDADGGVWRLHRGGAVEPWLLHLHGQPLPPTNFVLPDGRGRTWVTVSTRRQPRARGYRPGEGDGFIVCVDRQGPRLVADGLGYTNEVALHPSGRWLYVNETFARRLSRFELRGPEATPTLGPRETVANFGESTFPDGLAFDEDGGAWVVSIVSNRLIRMAPDGHCTLWLQDADAAHLAWAEAAYQAGTMGREHLDRPGGRRLASISSIAFAGADRRTALLGCLGGERLACLSLPTPGVTPPHWNHP